MDDISQPNAENPQEVIFARFLDENGKIIKLPSKAVARAVVLAYLAEKFEYGKNYTEKEVNAIINDWHTFHDYFVLRRELVESRLLSRTSSGSSYWREEAKNE